MGLVAILIADCLSLRLAIFWSAFYFSLGFYLHKNPFYRQPPKIMLLLAGVTSLCCFVVLLSTTTATAPYLLAMVPYSACVIVLLLHLGYRLRGVPALLSGISRYSFSIYLAHWLVLDLVALLIPIGSDAKLIVMILGGLAVPIVIGRLGNSLPYGVYLVGRAGSEGRQAGGQERIQPLAEA